MSRAYPGSSFLQLTVHSEQKNNSNQVLRWSYFFLVCLPVMKSKKNVWMILGFHDIRNICKSYDDLLNARIAFLCGSAIDT